MFCGQSDDHQGRNQVSEVVEALGLWASASGLVLWIRPRQGTAVSVLLATGKSEPAFCEGWLAGTWYGYEYELRIQLPWLPNNAELILTYENYAFSPGSGEPEEQLSGGVSMDAVPPRGTDAIPPWLLPHEPLRRVPEAEWADYAVVSFGEVSYAPHRTLASSNHHTRRKSGA